MRGEAPESTMNPILSLEVLIGGEETLLSGLGLKNFMSHRRIKTLEFLTRSCSSIPCHFFHAQGPFDGCFTESWSVFGFR